MTRFMLEAEAAWRAELECRTLAQMVDAIPPVFATTVTALTAATRR